jgi:hypothetical protein
VIRAVPEAQRGAVAGALAAAFGDRPLDELRRLHGGLSSALVYRAVIGARPYLVRVVTRIDGFNDPVRHHACLRIAADAGLAPRVIHTDDAAAITITELIDARPLASCPRPLLLDQLAALIVRLRATPRFPPLLEYLDGIDGIVAEVRASGLLPRLELFARYAELSAGYPREPDARVSAHNDLNPGNVLWDGARLWLIDWEAAFANDPYADLAQACNFFAPEPADEARLVAAVLGAPPDAYQRARLWLMRQAARMLFAMLLLRMVRAQRPDAVVSAAELAAPPLATLRGQEPVLIQTPEGQLRYALSVLGELDGSLRSPRCEGALRRVRGPASS